jgi:ribonuclease HIII
MDPLKEYILNFEELCGDETQFIIVLRHEKKELAIKKILERGNIKKTFSDMVYEIVFESVSIRLYKSGKMLLRGLRTKREIEHFLGNLLK